jgi:hypothetical protein
VVLDHHTDLHQRLAHPSADLRAYFEGFTEAAEETFAEMPAPEYKGRVNPMFYPFGSTPEGAGLFVGALAHDLFDARTYQVTTEMVDLAEALHAQSKDQFASIEPEEVPAPWGFAWLDRPWMVRDRSGGSMAIRAFSWGSQRMRLSPGYGPADTDAVRIAVWNLNTDTDDFSEDWAARRRSDALGPLTMTHSETIGVGVNYGTNPMVVLAHMMWSLMGMEITSVTDAAVGRPARRRAQGSIRHGDVRVVQLRRAAHDTGTGIRRVDWSCRWIVRGHRRRLPSGNTIWIKPYIKGPDGRPLKASDVVYRLER